MFQLVVNKFYLLTTALTVGVCFGFSDFEKDVKVIVDEKGTDYYLVPLDLLQKVTIKRALKTQSEESANQFKDASIVSRLINKLEKAHKDVSNEEFLVYNIAGEDANITLTRRTRDTGIPKEGCVHGDPYLYTF